MEEKASMPARISAAEANITFCLPKRAAILPPTSPPQQKNIIKSVKFREKSAELYVLKNPDRLTRKRDQA